MSNHFLLFDEQMGGREGWDCLFPNSEDEEQAAYQHHALWAKPTNSNQTKLTCPIKLFLIISPFPQQLNMLLYNLWNPHLSSSIIISIKNISIC